MFRQNLACLFNFQLVEDLDVPLRQGRAEGGGKGGRPQKSNSWGTVCKFKKKKKSSACPCSEALFSSSIHIRLTCYRVANCWCPECSFSPCPAVYYSRLRVGNFAGPFTNCDPMTRRTDAAQPMIYDDKSGPSENFA